MVDPKILEPSVEGLLHIDIGRVWLWIELNDGKECLWLILIRSLKIFGIRLDVDIVYGVCISSLAFLVRIVRIHSNNKNFGLRLNDCWILCWNFLFGFCVCVFPILIYATVFWVQIFINVPWYFSVLYSMFSPFLTQRTKSKFVISKEGNVAETLYK